jgi:signal transduction histidine kinase
MDDAVRRAARRLVPGPAVAAGEPGPDGAFRDGAGMADALARAVESGQPVAAPADAVDAGEQRRLLRALRREVERAWLAAPEAPDAGEVMRLLRGFRAQARALRAAPRPAAAAPPPEAVELLVEVAHDLRSPLTSILFLADTLQRGESGELNEVQRRQVALIYGAAMRLSALAGDVVEMGQPGERLVGSAPVAFSIRDTLAGVRDLVLPMAEEKHIDLRITAPRRDWRLGHPAALGRVLLNLAVNALKYTHEGFVEIRTRGGGDRVLFVVRDTGPGLEPSERRTLFEPFRPPADGERHFSGSGLGLAISRRLVRAMGSELRFQSRPGRGTRFHFTLHLPSAG